ncbi:MAG: glycosyl hydrolase [Actinomycetota bacterium]|nr:glycosyl hydrolase [Actinomycetota bacterium]
MSGDGVVVLSGSIGQGHDSVARACAAALAPRPVEILDCMALLGRGGALLGTKGFEALLGVVPAYDAFHFSVLRRGGALAERLATSSSTRLEAALRADPAVEAADLVVSVFATGVRPLAALRGARPDLRAVVLCTDATAHRLWVEPGIDRYLVCSTMAEGTVRSYLPDADVAVIPPPVRPELFAAPPSAAAREALGLPAEAPTALLLGGAWGKGPLEALAEALVRDGVEVLAVSGRNARLHRRLVAAAARLAGPGARLHAFGHRDDMASLFAAADVVVTSPGQACHEARVVGRPLVVIDSVPGHGRENLLLELTKPATLTAAPTPTAVTAAVRRALAGAVGACAPWPVTSSEEWAACLLAALQARS